MTDDRDNDVGGILVFISRDGYLDSLEIYSSADPIGAWPDAAHRHPLLRSRHAGSG
ncbi:MAG: hypothetical protein ABSE52_03100 [Candidatus Dormibacteria bacterium]